MTVLKQIAAVLVGLVLAGVMVALGIWQLNVYESQGREQAVQRAAAPPVDLVSRAAPGEEVGDVYGRTVRFTGRYDPDLQLFIADPDEPGRYRVLTAFRLRSGGAVAVVRGLVEGKQAPAPPAGTVTQTGVLLPSEASGAQGQPGAEPTSVALPQLAQLSQPELVNGFATLSADEARAQSLQPAPIALPEAHGRLRNGFYALQWWVFAGFAVFMGVRMARDFGREQREPDSVDGPGQSGGSSDGLEASSSPGVNSDSASESGSAAALH